MKSRVIHPHCIHHHCSPTLAARTGLLHAVKVFRFVLVLCGLVMVAHAQKTAPAYGKLPLSFEPSRGQAAEEGQYLSRGPGYSLLLSPADAVLQLRSRGAKSAQPIEQAGKTTTLQMHLLGADPKAAGQAIDKLPGTVNYFEGADPKLWETGLPTYQRVAYREVYPGVDVVYYGNQRELEYDFIIAPHADPGNIALGFTGASPRIDETTGDLVLKVSDGETRFHAPVVYQRDGNRKVPVKSSYVLSDGQVHFNVGAYDRAKQLVIDPVLSYLTYLGATLDDTINGMAVDAQGDVIVIGTTFSTNFPLKNAYDSVPTQYDRYGVMFVSKFNPTGTALVYSTYLGQSTTGNAVAVDTAGNAYAFATTNDPSYPVTAGAFQTLCGANYNNSTGARITGCSVTSATGNNSTALTKISPDGSQLVYSTFLSGNNGQTAHAVAVNSAGEAYVIGVTNAYCPAPPYNANGTGYQAYSCFPVTANAAESSVAHSNDDTMLFLTKFNAGGTGLVYSTVTSNHNPVGHYVTGVTAGGIALDAAGNAYVTGTVESGYFIAPTAGAYQTTMPTNGTPAYVAKYNPAGTATTSLVYATYLSGTTASNDVATGIAVDASGNAVVTGYTNSCTFPTTAGVLSPIPGGYVSSNICAGGFLTKLNGSGTGLVWSTYTGTNGANGRNNDNNDAIALGADSSVYIVGDDQSVALLPTVNPILTQSESHYTYIKHFTADGSAIVFSSAIGGTTDATSIPAGVFVDASGNMYIAGSTNSSTFPTTTGAFQKASANPGVNYNDGFIVKIAPTAATTTLLTLPSGTVTAGQSVKLTAEVTGQSGSTGTPTGTVTFLGGAAALGTGTLDSTGTATYTATSLNATTYSITASYAGDTSFAASLSPAQNLVVTPATPTVALTAPATAVVGASVTFGVTVTGTGGTPGGTITFKDGTAILGTATLTAGAASYSTSSLAAGAHSITASYSGDSLFASAVSATSTVTISVAPSITFAASPTSLTITRGSSGTASITATPVGGYTGTSTFSCGTLPAGATCVFAPASLTYSGNNAAQAVTLTVGTVTTAALTRPADFGQVASRILAAFLFLPMALLAGRRKARVSGGLLLQWTLIAGSIGILGLAGCAGGTVTPKATTTTTAAGSYTVAVTVTSGSNAVTLNLPLTVQ